MIGAALAYTPFLTPLDLHDHWWFTLAPLALGISIAYKAVRLKDLSKFWPAVAVMTVQIIGGMMALALLAFVIVEVLARWLP